MPNTEPPQQPESWLGFTCPNCGAPAAVERPGRLSTSGAVSSASWRITCPSCGITQYHAARTPMIRIRISA